MIPPRTTATPWRRLRRHAATLVLIGIYCAIAAPTVATVLLALRSNGLGFELVYSLMLAPWAILLGGPGAFLLGVVFGWMLLGLVGLGVNTMATRLGLAVVVATVAWWLAEPLPQEFVQPEGPMALFVDWAIWSASAAASALVFTRGWLAHRMRYTNQEV